MVSGANASSSDAHSRGVHNTSRVGGLKMGLGVGFVGMSSVSTRCSGPALDATSGYVFAMPSLATPVNSYVPFTASRYGALFALPVKPTGNAGTTGAKTRASEEELWSSSVSPSANDAMRRRNRTRIGGHAMA